MGIFYDSQKRQAPPWVIPFFVIATLALIVISYQLGQQKAKTKAAETKQEVDIFAK